jgi:hypothetical protein
MSYLSETCMSTACLRLSIEPIPEGSWLASLANLLPPWQWDRVRRSVYQRAGYRCQLCGREGMLHCHEVWQYNEETGIQWLRGFAALCRDCHDVKHILFNRDAARHKELMRHFIAVSRITREEAEAYVEAARQQQQKYDQRHWAINFGEYNCWMPALADKQQRQRHARFLRPHSKATYNPDSNFYADYF